MNNKLSVIIPSHREIFLQETIDDLLRNAREDIEVIVCLDSVDPETPLKEDKRVKVFKAPVKLGMRKCINVGAQIADGKYIMKSDAHCSFSEGFDVKLKEDCEPNWISIPRRYQLDPEKWERKKIKKYIDYLYTFPPYVKDGELFPIQTKKWRGEGGSEGSSMYRENERKDILIDDIMSFQGSCYFMHASHFEKIGNLNYRNFGPFGHESTELSLKTWLSGGRVVRNKNVWYAHLRQGKKWRLSRGFEKEEYQQAVDYTYKIFFGNWNGKTHELKYFINKFRPLDMWPKDWFSDKEIEIFKNA